MVLVVALLLAGLAVFWLAFWTYSRYVSNLVGVDDARPTPAHTQRDDKDYMPARRPVLMGHHFASIAGAGPIVGPIVAAAAFGWLPAILWILIAAPLMGAVHDYTTTMGSVRHRGASMGGVIQHYVGRRSSRFFLVFALLLVILVLAVFALVIANVFEAFPSAATASMLFLLLALLLGGWLHRAGGSLLAGTLVFVPLVFASVWAGLQYPIALPAGVWVPILLAYALVASVLPVWTLLQPRDYLSSFLLFAGLGAAMIGIFIGGFKGTDRVVLPFFTDFMGQGFGPLFPLLFVTIACGAVSGAHCLIACGTTSKQVARESHARTVGYGGMLLEGLVAIIAISAIAVVGFAGAASENLTFALPLFASGGAVFLGHLGIPLALGATFMSLMLASFLLTTLDTVARLGRYLTQELVPTPERAPTPMAQSFGVWARQPIVATVLPLIPAYLLAAGGTWTALWPLFGSANQLLGALAFLAVTAWLAKLHTRKPLWSTAVPAAFLFVTTVSAFGYLTWRALTAPEIGITNILQAVVAVTLVILATIMAWDTILSVRSTRATSAPGLRREAPEPA